MVKKLINIHSLIICITLTCARPHLCYELTKRLHLKCPSLKGALTLPCRLRFAESALRSTFQSE
eukprot:2114483-Pleurochrysis_carterae.AAC.1